MTTDMTSLTGILRIQPNSNALNRVPNNVVPFKNDNTQPSVQEQKQFSSEGIQKAANQVNEFIKQIDRNLEFSVDESSGRVIITVTEPETGKIIRQIPPEELLVIAKLISENFANPIPSGVLLSDES